MPALMVLGLQNSEIYGILCLSVVV